MRVDLQKLHKILEDINAIITDNKDGIDRSILLKEKRFAYYTNMETAIKILKYKEIWLRNSMMMNDFSEIQYGINLLEKYLRDRDSSLFKVLNNINKDIVNYIKKNYEDWKRIWMFETYITSLSEHFKEEDTLGRLSMWRAYGDIALVINSKPFIYSGPELGIFSAPIQYTYYDDLYRKFEEISKIIDERRKILKRADFKIIIDAIFITFLLAVISSKHPGFHEEKEWRVYYIPSLQNTKLLMKDVVVIDGEAQIIYKIPLKSDPVNGLMYTDLLSCLDRVIIGPTDYPYVNMIAFSEILRDIGVPNPEERVIFSEIPLRR